jgi:phage/plasmid-associated DNA primase
MFEDANPPEAIGCIDSARRFAGPKIEAQLVWIDQLSSRIIIEYLTTDVANGHRFARDHKQHVRWLIDEQEWRVWDGRRWRRYKTDEKVIDLAKKTVRTNYQEAVAMESDPLRKWATRSHGSERLSAMVKMAKSDQQMWSEYKELSTRTRICSTSPTARWT